MKNETKNEIEVLKDLSIRDDKTITKTDKGEVVVVIDSNYYISEAKRQLNSKGFYKEISNEPTELNRKKANNAIKELKSGRLLDKKIATNLGVQEEKASTFYMFPKKHKPENPGRPLINPVDYHTPSLSQYLDHHLQPHTKELKVFLKTQLISSKKQIIRQLWLLKCCKNSFYVISKYIFIQ